MFGRGKIRKGQKENSVTHELEMGRRHSADLRRRSGRAVCLGVSISLAAAVNPQG